MQSEFENELLGWLTSWRFVVMGKSLKLLKMAVIEPLH